MGQVSWRASDELLDRVRHSAHAAGLSVNGYLTNVLNLATSEDEAETEGARLRQRLRAAGLLASDDGKSHRRPTAEAAASARRQAGKGTPLSDLVAGMRS